MNIKNNRHDKGWTGGQKYPYKKERLNANEIAARSSQNVSLVRNRLNSCDWSLERFFDQYGDKGE